MQKISASILTCKHFCQLEEGDPDPVQVWLALLQSDTVLSYKRVPESVLLRLNHGENLWIRNIYFPDPGPRIRIQPIP
jgi:hypothetical protein